jgi:RNA polymerase sigma-70 factor (ECF subfamily)
VNVHERFRAASFSRVIHLNYRTEARSDHGRVGELRQLDPEAAGDHLDRLYRTALAMCGSAETAEELVQETYVKVLSRPRFLRRDDDFGYLVRALRNVWYSHLRARGARPQQAKVSADELAAARGDPELSLEAREVLGAVAHLPDEFRDAVAAVDIGGLSYAEAARALGVAEGTIMSRLSRGRARVAEALAAEETG